MVTLVATDGFTAEIENACREQTEVAGVVLARAVHESSDARLLAREVLWVAPEHYAHQSAQALSIRSDGYVHALGRAAATGCVPIWFHTHPGLGSNPRPSPHDHVVDRQLADLFRLRADSRFYAALIAAPSADGVAFTGFLESEDGSRQPIDRLWSVGDRLRLTLASGVDSGGLSPQFDRSVRAFGSAVQSTIGALRVAIVGCGGTGSAVAEQIVRLGARHLTLVDPDVLGESNVTRVYGSRPADVGQAKVQVLKRHLLGIAPTSTVEDVQGAISTRGVATRLLGSDVVFGCTDDNSGRLVLSRLASYFLTPVIDCGVLLSSDANHRLTGIHGRVTTLVPGQACLVCRNRIDLTRAMAEVLTPGERARRVDEGYAPALPGVEPAVVAYTTLVASLAISELLERLIGFGPEPRPSEVLLRGHDRELSTNAARPRDGHYCDARSGKLGTGLTDPFLEQTWPDSV